MKLILASQSPARRRLLKRLGLKFKSIAPSIDEKSFQKRIKSPKKLVHVLAEEKASVIAEKFPNAVVIGSDQMMVCRSRIFGKPKTVKAACEQLAYCSGKQIELLTAVSVQGPARAKTKSKNTSPRFEETFVHSTKMKFRKLSSTEIEAYVRLDLPLECAGSFMFEKHGASLFERVVTDDPTAIEGLPILHLNGILRRLL